VDDDGLAPSGAPGPGVVTTAALTSAPKFALPGTPQSTFSLSQPGLPSSTESAQAGSRSDSLGEWKGPVFRTRHADQFGADSRDQASEAALFLKHINRRHGSVVQLANSEQSYALRAVYIDRTVVVLPALVSHAPN
jgi:hypothetical protein